jgi:hypothetical protein
VLVNHALRDGAEAMFHNGVKEHTKVEMKLNYGQVDQLQAAIHRSTYGK